MDENLPSSSVSEDVTVTNIKREEDSPDDQQQLFLQQVESADKLYLAPDEYELDEGEGDEQSENEEDDEIICDSAKGKLQKEQTAVMNIEKGIYEPESNLIYVDDDAAEEDSAEEEENDAQKDDTVKNQSPRRTISGETSEELPVNTTTISGEKTFEELLPVTTISTTVDNSLPTFSGPSTAVDKVGDGKNEQSKKSIVASFLSNAQVYLCSSCPYIFASENAFKDHLGDHLEHNYVKDVGNENISKISAFPDLSSTSTCSPLQLPLPSQLENVHNEKAPKNKRKRVISKKLYTCHFCPTSSRKSVYKYYGALVNHLKREHPQEELIITFVTPTVFDTPPETTQPAMPDPTKPLPLDRAAKSSQSSANLGEAHECRQGAPRQACPTRQRKLYCPFCGELYFNCCRFQEHLSRKSCLLNELKTTDTFTAEKDAQNPYICLKCLLGLADSKALDEHVCSSL